MQNFKTILKLFILKLKNPFILVSFLFLLWMLIFDSNSLLNHIELSKKIKQLKKDEIHYKNQIKSDSISLNQLSNPVGLEKYAREKYHMKKENEEIFLIENKN